MKLSELTNTTVGIWGGGRDGRAAATQLATQSCTLVVISDFPSADSSSQQLAADFSIPLVGPDALDSLGLSFIVRSPGVSRYRPEILSLRDKGIPSSNLFALWLADQAPERIIGVTGTKGKSTTSALIEQLLVSTGTPVSLVGNIGTPVTESGPQSVCVVEVSSYQASDCTTSPGVGVLTTLGEDHITWHGDIGRYHADKLNLFTHAQLQHMIFHTDDSVVTDALHQRMLHHKQFVAPFDIGDIIERSRSTGVLTRMGNTTFPRNLALAIHAAFAVNPALSPEHVFDAIENFAPLPSRQNLVATVNEIEFIDDALASNPLAVISAIERFSDAPMILILGGHDRNVDYSEFINAVNSADHVHHVVVMGDTDSSFASRVAPALTNAVRTFDENVENAVITACELAKSGSRIVFSPAAPTPPHQGDFSTRSEDFRRAIERASSLF